MTGPEHYKEAARLLNDAVSWDYDERQGRADAVVIAAAQVHATLALAAATAEPIAQSYSGFEDTNTPRAWSEAIS